MSAISLKDKAYAMIKDKIIRCEYLPGEILVESEIIEAVGASRTPIREALNKLEQERLVHIVPKRGVFVAELTVATVCEVHDVRELVEPHFVQTFGPLVPASRIDALIIELDELDKNPDSSPERYYHFDNELHMLFAKYANNSYLQMMMDQIYGQNNRIRILTGDTSRKRLDESQQEHRMILEPLRERDFTAAAQAMRQHLQIARDAALNAITKSSSLRFGLD